MSISLRFSGCLLVAALSISAYAQQQLQPRTIEIRGNKVVAEPNAQHWFDSLAQTRRAEPVQVLIQFHQLPSDGMKAQLMASGITLLQYIPAYTYTAIVHPHVTEVNTTIAGIRAVVTIRPEWKLDERITNTLNLKATRQATLLVSFAQEASQVTIDNLLTRLGGRITDRKFEALKTFEVALAQDKIAALAANAWITYIGLPAEVQPLNFDARSSSGANLLSSPAAPGGYNLDGSGVTVGVGDNTSAIYHVDARDRVINFNPADATMHGIHTTLTVGGKGIMDPRTLGMAPSVKILNHIYDLVWAQTPFMYADHNMTITNNSYAAVLGDCVYAGTYDQYAQMLDEMQKDYPFVQHVFAAGNDGLMQCGAYPTSYGTVTGGYQPSKNILTVGGMAKDNIIWPKSARGPVKDGRLKPEITAYSFSIYSGNIFDMYGHSNGTSMSCPVVAGNLALIEQRYKQLHTNQNIPSHLLKALAMNGATDVGNPGPDYSHGYGLINTIRSLDMLDNNRYLIDSVNNAASKTHTINVPANTSKLKVMIYWHDDAASPLATSALVNNVDLEVVSGATTYLPWVLDPTPGNVANNAVRGVDSRNNSEQVTIDNPAAGNYTINVKGTLVPAGKQQYVLVYDFVPDAIKIKFPVAGSTMPAGDSLFVYWDAPDDPNGFKLEYSDNNGGNWNVLHSNLPATQRHFYWRTPNISAAQCSLRISRNNTALQDASGTFVINPEPQVQLSANQCPGYMAIEWGAVPNVTGYEILRKIGDDLRPVDTVTATNYVFSGLSQDSLQYAAVRPLINGVRGWRSKAVKRMPNDGSCAGSISDGDLMVEAIPTPASGRQFTSSALTASEPVTVRVRNLDDVPVNNYRVHYSINGGAWQTQNAAAAIPANSSVTVNLPAANFAATGLYQIRVAVENLSPDPVKTNDTLVKFVRQLSNQPLNINNTFTDDFENAPSFSVLKDSMGVLPNEHWDFVNSTDSGRLRSFVASDVLISGQRSLSMDLLLNKPDNQNYLLGTFNLQGFNTASSEARLEFDYKLHGKPKVLAGNEVWVRGSDTAPWVHVYTFDTSVVPGQKINTGSLSITHALVNAVQNFSSSFQVRMGQRDTSLIAMNEYGNGLTIDNFKLYTVKNDVQLLSIVSPGKFNCRVDSAALTVRVYNSDNLPQDTVELFYRFDNGALVRDTIFFMAPKDTVTHTFDTRLNGVGIGSHVLDVWLVAQGDTYTANDSILNYRWRNQPNITSFPYLENFEQGDGNWYTDGFNSTWQYGTPNSLRLKKAASGTKVWATNLTGNYKDNEESYLYSPCFELSTLQNPMLSFSLSSHIENCGSVLCDAAYVEYSADGISWTKLGASGQGYNWYGDLQVWNDSNTRWRVASIALPKDIPSLKLRFVLRSDAGAAWDGIALDDIHIFDLKYPVYEGGSTEAANAVSSGQWTDFVSSGKIMAQVQSPSSLGNTDVRLYHHAYVLNPVVRHYNLARNYVVQSAQTGTDSVWLRLFITDEEVRQLIGDRNCDTCSRADDAYRLGITKYDDEPTFENGSLTDNVNGSYSFIPYTAIRWVPYERGYYAEAKLNGFSEFWFNTGIPGKAAASMMVYPNPITDGQFHIVWSGVPGTEMKLVLFDAIGRKVYDATAASSDFDTRTTVTLPPLETGVYTLRCFIGDQSHTIKLLIRN